MPSNGNGDDGDSDGEPFGERFADFLDSIGLEELTDDYREEHRSAESNLEMAFGDVTDLSETPHVAEVNRVNEHRDGGDVVVPVVPVVFEEAGEPARQRVYEVVGAVLAAVHPVFDEADCHVRHYDVQFAYADGREETVVYRRVTVDTDLAERALTDATFDAMALARAVQEGDDGDDGVPPVDFQRFDARSASAGSYAGGHAAVHAAAVAASSGAAASCASSAAAGAGAGGAPGC
jgi:hypothetical protein